MGDKSKKDKDKGAKQNVAKQNQKAKERARNSPNELPDGNLTGRQPRPGRECGHAPPT